MYGAVTVDLRLGIPLPCLLHHESLCQCSSCFTAHSLCSPTPQLLRRLPTYVYISLHLPLGPLNRSFFFSFSLAPTTPVPLSRRKALTSCRFVQRSKRRKRKREKKVTAPLFFSMIGKGLPKRQSFMTLFGGCLPEDPFFRNEGKRCCRESWRDLRGMMERCCQPFATRFRRSIFETRGFSGEGTRKEKDCWMRRSRAEKYVDRFGWLWVNALGCFLTPYFYFYFFM